MVSLENNVVHPAVPLRGLIKPIKAFLLAFLLLHDKNTKTPLNI